MENNIRRKNEGRQIKIVFFLLGLLIYLPSYAMVNVSFLINDIYKESMCVTIMGIYGVCMAISSVFQLILELTSFKLIIGCNICKTVAILFFTLYLCLLKSSKYYLYFISGILGLLSGYLYSACTKYSLLLLENVNGYLITGVSFCGFFFFFANLPFSYFTIKAGDVNTYYKAIGYSLSFFIVLEILIILYIIYVQMTSFYFNEEKKRIENSFYSDSNNILKNKELETEYKYVKKCSGSINETHIDVNEIVSPANVDIKSVADSGIYKNNNNDYNHINTHYNILNKTNKNRNTNLKEKLVYIKNKLNFNSITLGIKLIKYYYICCTPICFTVFITYLVYPHLIPNMLKKTEFEKYFYIFLYQLSNLIFSMLMTFLLKQMQFLKQPYVFIMSFLRLLLIWICYSIINTVQTNFIYSNVFVSFVVVLIGSTNSIIRSLSFARIRECFENNDKRDHYVSVASSFCALLYLFSYALSSWFVPIILSL
ncbi:nucleoside transporter 4, putative [Hepatocystis sp. ex Piliocolobus tephrosceles]|nr:nucleoside transporter 4, putative [Hepatocystis sp. ex Piliocolobus tephrosceles]